MVSCRVDCSYVWFGATVRVLYVALVPPCQPLSLRSSVRTNAHAGSCSTIISAFLVALSVFGMFYKPSPLLLAIFAISVATLTAIVVLWLREPRQLRQAARQRLADTLADGVIVVDASGTNLSTTRPQPRCWGSSPLAPGRLLASPRATERWAPGCSRPWITARRQAQPAQFKR